MTRDKKLAHHEKIKPYWRSQLPKWISKIQEKLKKEDTMTCVLNNFKMSVFKLRRIVLLLYSVLFVFLTCVTCLCVIDFTL